MIVSNSGPLIHLAKIDRLDLLKELFGKVTIPLEVKLEVVDRGKDEGMADAFLIETEIENGWIAINRENDKKLKEIAESAGIDIGEASAIMLAKKKKCPVLIDDLAARRFAAGMGLCVVGSIGVLLKSRKNRPKENSVQQHGSIGVLLKSRRTHKISKDEALDALDRLGRVMWLSIDVYEDARRIIEEI